MSNRDGVTRIAQERMRQLEKLGWSHEHDDEHADGSIAMAAVCYAAAAGRERIYVQREYAASVSYTDPFPWQNDARPYNGNMLIEASDEQAIRLLEKAGALIAAEIDRLLRKAGRR